MDFFGKKDKMMEAFDAAEEKETEGQAVEQAAEEEEKATPITKKRSPFAIWEVGGKEYKLKLNTATITQLEAKYKTNLMNIMGTGEGGMPALTVMLDIAQNAMKDWQHGVSKSMAADLFDKYLAEGGSQLQFYTSVYMNIFAVSGFFSTTLTEQMQSTLEEANQTL